jgi:tRNA 2-thiouridine synthesizing protein A
LRLSNAWHIKVRLSFSKKLNTLKFIYKAGGHTMADFDQELDASGLNCPLPILRAKKTLNGMESGNVLHIIATDPGSVKDFEAFANQTGNELMESKEVGGKFEFLIKKA